MSGTCCLALTNIVAKKSLSTWHFLSSRMLKMCDLMFLVIYFLFMLISLIIHWFYHNYENYTCHSWNQNYFSFSLVFFSIKFHDPAIFIIGRVLAIWPHLAGHLVRSGGCGCRLIVRYCTITFLGFALDTDRMRFLPYCEHVTIWSTCALIFCSTPNLELF